MLKDTMLKQAEPLAARERFSAPIWTLLLLSPFIAEVLSGSTRASVIFVYIPEVMVWGVGALLCRELVRRWQAGGVSLLLLGLSLAVAEEFIIQQTSLAPLPFPGSHPDYGRMWGINLVYFLFMLGFESVWVVVVPVQATELLFPERAAQPWLHKRGIISAVVVFLIGCRAAWYGWNRQARPRLNAAPYNPPLAMVSLALLAIGGLILLAYLIRGLGRPSAQNRRRVIPAWLAGLIAFTMGSAWFYLITLQFIPRPVQPFWLALAAGAAWAILAFILFSRWSSHPAWSNAHRLAVALGATLACMATPYLTIASWPPIDVIGLLLFHALALAGFVLLARKVFAKAPGISS